jgi:hypothetical protein
VRVDPNRWLLMGEGTSPPEFAGSWASS